MYVIQWDKSQKALILAFKQFSNGKLFVPYTMTKYFMIFCILYSSEKKSFSLNIR